MQSDGGSPSAASSLAPVAPGERIIHLDVLRGIALFGVLIANLWLWFSGTVFRFPEVEPGLERFSLDTVAFFFTAFFVSGKAITTFSFLFGLGFAVQMMRAESKGRPVVPLFARRMTILLAMGVLHAVFLWYGDILATYALLGFVLLLFRRASNRTLLTWAVVLVVVLPLVLSSIRVMRSLSDSTERPQAGVEAVETKEGTATAEAVATAQATDSPEAAEAPEAEDAPATVDSAEAAGEAATDGDNEASAEDVRDRMLLDGFVSGEPSRIVSGNLQMLATMYRPPRGLRKFWLLGIFLIGLYVGRRRVFENPTAFRRLLRLVVFWGFPIGILATAGEMAMRIGLSEEQWNLLPWLPLAMAGIDLFATTPFAFAYIAAATLLLERVRWRRILGAFAPVGQMALTNYVGQTIICLLLYIGLGLMGSIHHAMDLLIAVAIFGVQMVISAWWLRHFRFGPLEWLWRSATYGKLQPMRVSRLTEAAPVPVS